MPSGVISSVTAGFFALPFVRPFANARVRYDTLTYVRVSVSAEGRTGWGEITVMPGYSSETATSILTAIRQHYEPVLTGMSVFGTAELHERLVQALPENHYARAALDLAFTDLRAQLLGLSAADLLGGARVAEVRLAGIVTLASAHDMVEQARAWIDKGALALQVKIADPMSASNTISAIRSAVGPEIKLAVDANGSFTRLDALRTMDVIQPLDIAFFEQPVASDDLDGMAMVTRRGCIPVVADEMVVTARDAYRIANAGAAHGFNIKLNKSGCTESQNIAAIAAAAGMTCAVGSMLETRFGTFAGIHFAATFATPAFPPELVGPWLIRDDVTGAEPEHGSVELSWRIPTGCGWGASAANVVN